MRWTQASLLVALATIAAVAGIAARLDDRGVVVESRVLSHSPSAVVHDAGRRRSGPVALLVHGYSCNKSMMMPLARYLARHGITSYVIDLPGHGASPLRFSREVARNEVRSILAEVASLEGIGPEHVILVGHSYGGAVLAETVAARADAAVFLGPNYLGGLSSHAPRAMLALTAERDHAWIVTATRSMMLDVERSERVPGAQRSWDVAAGTDHLGLVFDERVFRRTLDFIVRSTGFRSADTARRQPFPVETLLAASCTVVAVFGAALVLAGRFATRRSSTTPCASPEHSLHAALVLAVSCAAAGIVRSHWPAFAPIRLAEGGRIASLFIVTGAAACIVEIVGYRGRHLPRGAEWGGALLGLVMFGAVYVAAGLTFAGRVYSVDLGPHRVTLAAALFVSLLPFFAVTEGMLETCVNSGTKMATASAILLSYGALAIMAPFVFGNALLFRLVPTLLVAGAAGLVAGTGIRAVTRSTTASAVFCAACSGWILAAGFARY